MTDPRIDRLATLITTYSTPIRSRDTAVIVGGVDAAPLLSAIEREVVARGGYPLVIPMLDSIVPSPGLFFFETLRNGTDDQLEWISPIERYAFEEADHLIVVATDANAKSLAEIDPARMAIAQRAKAPYIGAWLQRSGAGESDWLLTIYPTEDCAQDARMSLDDYTEFLFRALMVDRDDPVAAWKALAAGNDRLIERLQHASMIRIEGTDTDLTLEVEGRTWLSGDGTKNLPDGEVYTAPIEDSACGHIRFSNPLQIEGRDVTDIRLAFEHGLVTEAHASAHEDVLHRLLETDDGARRLGEFAFGTNFGLARATGNVLLDEKVGGTVHLALGSAYPESGGTNESAIHHDLVCDLRPGRVTVDGRPFLVDGAFIE